VGLRGVLLMVTRNGNTFLKKFCGSREALTLYLVREAERGLGVLQRIVRCGCGAARR
jgi:hypothetical protein